MSKARESITKKKRHPVRVITAFSMIALILLAGGFGWYQLNRYESAILDVCADQQDAYVQLVLDQINLKENREDEEMITDILGTLDSSSEKYWTFSKDQSMLFVKDVVETNRYKSLTTATYFVSDSAQTFFKNLEVNRVTHRTIRIQGKTYIASGVIFAYDDASYRLCLLTNRDVLLQNNLFLGAKMQTLVLFAVILVLLLLIPMGFAQWVRTLLLRQDESGEMIAALNKRVTELNERLEHRDLHDTKNRMWKKDTMPVFVEKLRERGVAPLVKAEIAFRGQRERTRFLSQAELLLDASVLRFGETEGSILLLFLRCERDDVRTALRPLLSDGMTVEQLWILDEDEESEA